MASLSVISSWIPKEHLPNQHYFWALSSTKRNVHVVGAMLSANNLSEGSMLIPS